MSRRIRETLSPRGGTLLVTPAGGAYFGVLRFNGLECRGLLSRAVGDDVMKKMSLATTFSVGVILSAVLFNGCASDESSMGTTRSGDGGGVCDLNFCNPPTGTGCCVPGTNQCGVDLADGRGCVATGTSGTGLDAG